MWSRRRPILRAITGSSTTVVLDPGNAWCVHFYFANVNGIGKSRTLSVRAVRTGHEERTTQRKWPSYAGSG